MSRQSTTSAGQPAGKEFFSRCTQHRAQHSLWIDQLHLEGQCLHLHSAHCVLPWAALSDPWQEAEHRQRSGWRRCHSYLVLLTAEQVASACHYHREYCWMPVVTSLADGVASAHVLAWATMQVTESREPSLPPRVASARAVGWAVARHLTLLERKLSNLTSRLKMTVQATERYEMVGTESCLV